LISSEANIHSPRKVVSINAVIPTCEDKVISCGSDEPINTLCITKPPELRAKVITLGVEFWRFRETQDPSIF